MFKDVGGTNKNDRNSRNPKHDKTSLKDYVMSWELSVLPSEDKKPHCVASSDEYFR